MTLLPRVPGEPVVCPPNKLLSQAGIKRMVRWLKGWRYAGKKMFSVSRTQGSISLLEESTQPTESVQTLLTCYRQVVSRPQWHAEDWIVGNSEQAGTERQK